jgi:hypothetical protein
MSNAFNISSPNNLPQTITYQCKCGSVIALEQIVPKHKPNIHSKKFNKKELCGRELPNQKKRTYLFKQQNKIFQEE